MAEFSSVKSEIESRGDLVAPILPGASWINLSGNFTAKELRVIATEIEENFSEMIKTNGNQNGHI